MRSRPHAGQNSAWRRFTPYILLVHCEQYRRKRLLKWYIPSVDTDVWTIVFLEISCARIVHISEGAVEVMVRQVVGGSTRYLVVNSVYIIIRQLKDKRQSPGSDDRFCSGCLDDTAKVRLFVLDHISAGFTFPPAITKLPFLRMWDFDMKSMSSPGLFATPTCVQ